MHALIRLTPPGAGHAAIRPRAPARPGAITAGNRDLTTKLTHEPNNVKVYRIVKDYPLFLKVKSSQSGIPSHCWRGYSRLPVVVPLARPGDTAACPKFLY